MANLLKNMNIAKIITFIIFLRENHTIFVPRENCVLSAVLRIFCKKSSTFIPKVYLYLFYKYVFMRSSFFRYIIPFWAKIFDSWEKILHYFSIMLLSFCFIGHFYEKDALFLLITFHIFFAEYSFSFAKKKITRCGGGSRLLIFNYKCVE